MKVIIDQIFAELKEEVEKGATLPLLKLPKLEDELRPFVVRELTREELDFLTARTTKVIENDKMHMRVMLAVSAGMSEQLDKEQEQNERLRFQADALDTLFYWMLSESTGWKFASLFQRQDGDKSVLIGLTGPQARAYYEEKDRKDQLAQVPASTLVN